MVARTWGHQTLTEIETNTRVDFHAEVTHNPPGFPSKPASLVGAQFVIATPPGWQPEAEAVRGLTNYHWSIDPEHAAHDADVIVGDVWIPMNKGLEADIRHATL